MYIGDTGVRGLHHIVYEFVDNSVRESFHGTSKFIAPLALTLFVWIFFMNFMDLIPVDWLPWVASLLGVGNLKIVPSTDNTSKTHPRTGTTPKFPWDEMASTPGNPAKPRGELAVDKKFQ